MSTLPSNDPAASLNEVLSEVIDVVQDVKQAFRKVPQTHALHAVLDRLAVDLRTWARLLADQDEALGVSPLASMTSVAGRRLPNLWPGTPSDDEVRRVVAEHLDRLGQHVAAALAQQENEGPRAALADIERELLVQRQALREL